MNNKKINILWGASLIIINVISLTLLVLKFLWIYIPTAVTIILGIVDLIFIALLAYTTVKKFKK
ncbi:MAG: hypothetical protein K2H23_01900 [Oscillospiraceae bacterium]|nr:hypothetical protein [Oscillospiraceae bacterium]